MKKIAYVQLIENAIRCILLKPQHERVLCRWKIWAHLNFALMAVSRRINRDKMKKYPSRRRGDGQRILHVRIHLDVSLGTATRCMCYCTLQWTVCA